MESKSLNIRIDVFGEVQIDRNFVGMASRAMLGLEHSALTHAIFNDLQLITRVMFLTEGRGQWPGLADSTAAAKRRKGLSPWIERATETLFKSLTEDAAEGAIRESGVGFMRWGSNVPYGMFQQKGTSRMPMRKLIALRQVEKIAVVKQVQRFILTGEIVSLA